MPRGGGPAAAPSAGRSFPEFPNQRMDAVTLRQSRALLVGGAALLSLAACADSPALSPQATSNVNVTVPATTVIVEPPAVVRQTTAPVQPSQRIENKSQLSGGAAKLKPSQW